MHNVNWETYSFMRVGYVPIHGTLPGGGGGQFVTTVHFVQHFSGAH